MFCLSSSRCASTFTNEAISQSVTQSIMFSIKVAKAYFNSEVWHSVADSDIAHFVEIELIQVKEEGWTGFSVGLQGCSEGFPEGEARGKS